MNKATKGLLAVNIVLVTIIFILVILLSVKNENTYDVSMMREVGTKEILEMFEDKKTYVLYFGRETCGICVELVPELAYAQKNLNYITQYVDITKIDRNSDDWKRIADKLSIESTQPLTASGKGETVDGTYGYFLTEYGFTPTVVVLKDGKQVGGFIGGLTGTDVYSWIKEKIS